MRGRVEARRVKAWYAAHGGGMIFGIDLSSASETSGVLVRGSFPTRASATAHVALICRAQPGVEYEVVT